MASRENSDLKMALVGSAGAILGGVLTVIVGSLFVDANTERTTNVQLIQVAVGLLSAKDRDVNNAGEKVLREWAVDTINETAKVKFGSEAKELLVNGEIKLAQVNIRLAEGGGLFALPIFYEEMQRTIGDPEAIIIDRIEPKINVE